MNQNNGNKELFLLDYITNFFFDFSSELYFILDENFRFKEVNKTFKTTLGYEEQELIGRDALNFIYPEDTLSFESLKKEVNTEDKNYKIRLLKKDGKVTWLEWKVKKEKELVLVSAKDFSSQKETEDELLLRNKELEQEKAKVDAMLINIGDGVIGINEGGEIAYVNPQAQMILGFTDQELLGKTLIHYLKLENEKGEEVPIGSIPIHAALLSKRKVIESRYSYIKKDGTKLPVAITATPVVLHDLVIGGVNVFRDITKEREVDRMKTEFISLASHQLRTPLSAMKWFSELLMDSKSNLTIEQIQLLENIYQSNERMIELVNALLNISRIESGRIIIEPVPTDLIELINQVILELQLKVKEKDIKLAVSAHELLPKINIDPKLIRHVYMNLLTNSIKYTQHGGEIIVIISRSGGEIISQVSDNGYGIPKSQQGQVFQKFFRADNILKVETDGTGLGLYLIKAIVDSSGGKIWFKSEEGQGSTFWFSLPIAGTPPKKGEVSIDT